MYKNRQDNPDGNLVIDGHIFSTGETFLIFLFGIVGVCIVLAVPLSWVFQKLGEIGS